MRDAYLNGIDYAIIALYLGVVVTLSWRIKQRATTSLEQYLLGGRAMPWWMLGISGVMDFWDVAGTMIIVSFLFLLGPLGLLVEFRGGAVLVLAVIMLWTGKWHRRSGCLTGAEWMTFRFGDGRAGQSAQLARAIAGIVLTVGMIAYLVKGTGLFLATFLPFSPAQCAFVLVASATTYSMLSGFEGVVVIHLIQMGIVIAAAVAITITGASHGYGVDALGAIAERVTGNPRWTAATPALEATLPAGYEAYRPLTFIASLFLLRNVLFGLGAGDDPKYFAARSDADCGRLTLLWISLTSVRWLMMISIAVLGLGVVAELFPDLDRVAEASRLIESQVPGASANWAAATSQIANHAEEFSEELIAGLQSLLGPEWRIKLPLVSSRGTIDPERVMPSVLLLRVPPGIRSLVVVSLIAAAMAGFGAWVNQAAGFFVKDVYQKHVRPQAQVSELMAVAWAFILTLVTAGFLFAYSVPNLNDVWTWIIMGLGSGMMFPQLLPLYWQRFNGVGYTVGMLAGVIAAVGLRALAPVLGESWQFLQQERWLLPVLGGVGLTASVVGSFLSRPAPDAVLRRYYRMTLPFGFWKPYSQELPAELQRRIAIEHRRDIAALPPALLFQALLFLTPMLAVIRNWRGAGTTLAMALGSFAALYFVWLRRLRLSDENVALVRSHFAALERAEETPPGRTASPGVDAADSGSPSERPIFF